MWFKLRSHELEWMDEGLKHITLEEYYDALHQLDKVGRLLGGDQVIYQELQRLSPTPKSMVDIGCGGGHLAYRLAQRYPHSKIIGIDIDPEAIRFAKHTHGKLPPNLMFCTVTKSNLSDYLKNCSVILSSLVCHHLNDVELIEFIVTAVKQAQQAVILNDLHRHCLAYASYRLLAPLLFRNKMVTHDGLISIKRAFHQSDWHQYMQQANINKANYTLRWYFPFRWGVNIRCQ